MTTALNLVLGKVFALKTQGSWNSASSSSFKGLRKLFSLLVHGCKIKINKRKVDLMIHPLTCFTRRMCFICVYTL